MPASSPQIHRAADSLYHRQYAFLKLPPYEVQKIAETTDTWSSDEPVLQRQGLQQFPERNVRHFKPGEDQNFLSVSQQPAWLEVVDVLECASVDLLDAIAMSTHLGLTAGAFRGILDTPSQTPSSSSLDVIQYLPVAETVPSCKPEGLCALHHDRGLLTLIWSDTVEGLQVVNTKTGLFENVLVPGGYILVLPGYTLQRATCGIYKAAAHRVTMQDVEGERLAVIFKLRSPDTALLDFHTALTAAGKQVEPRFAGPIRVIELLAMFDEMHPSINDAGSQQKDKVLTPRQAAGTDPASGPSWTLSPPDALQVLAQAGTASSNSVSHKPLDCFKAAVDEGLPHGRRNQVGTTAHSGGQAQPAPGPSSRCYSLMERFWKKEEIPKSLNPLAVSWDPVLGLSRASPHVYSGANAHTAPTHRHLSSGARAVSPPPGLEHMMPHPHDNVAAGGDLDTSESGMSDDEDESAAHLRLPSYPKIFVRNLVSRSSGARAVSPPPGLEHMMPHPHDNVAAGGDLDTSESGMSDDEDESAAQLRLPSYPKVFVRNLVSRSSGARAVSPPPGLEHMMLHPHDNVAAGGVLDRDAEHAADPGRQPERPECHISEKGKIRSKARALKKKKACREARLLRERQMQSVGT